MAQVPSLKRISCLVTVQAVLNVREDTSSASASKLISLFQTDSFTAVSGSVLLEILEYYRHEVTDNILLCLVPPHVKQLCLKDCTQLSASGIEQLLKRCRQMDKLDLSGCDQVLKATLFQLVGSVSPHMTSVTLENCSLASDALVKNLLKNLPRLNRLSLASCENITDDAFMLNKAAQLRSSKYVTELPGNESSKPRCALTSINISCCDKLTSAGVRNITSLCGHSLRHVNISYTKIDCISLLYLAGLSMYSAFKVAMASDLSNKQPNFLKSFHPLPGNITSMKTPDIIVQDIEGSGDEEISDTGLQPTEDSSSTIDCNSLDCDADVPKHMNPSSGPLTDSDGVQTDTDGTDKIAKESGTERDSVENVQATASNNEQSKAASSVKERQDWASNHGTVKSDTFKCISHDISWSDISTESEGEESSKLSVCSKEFAEAKVSDNCQFGQEKPSTCTATISDLRNNIAMRNGYFLSANKEKSDLYECIQGKLGFAQKLFDPQLISLEIDGIDFQNVELGEACLTEFFNTNTSLEKFSMSWGELSDTMVEHVARCSPQLKTVSLVDCDSLSASGIANLCMKCHKLESVDFQGVCFFGDAAVFPLVAKGHARQLNLAESNITDNILHKIATCCGQTLHELDLSWCEEMDSDDAKGQTELATNCCALRKLALRQCPIVEATVSSLSHNCTLLKELNLSSVNCISDSILVSLSMNLRELCEIDISWNSAVTDVGAGAILTYCTKLKEANFAGIKQLTTDPFLAIISDARRWRRSQALLRLKYHERKELNDDHFSSDEEFDDLYLPHRSTVYATRLKYLNVEYCDQVNDTEMAGLVAVCRGTLRVQNYYAEDVKPSWINCQKGRVFLAPRF